MTKPLNKTEAVPVIRKLLAAGVLSKVRQTPVESEWGLEGELLEAARRLHAHPEWLQWLAAAADAPPAADVQKCRDRWFQLREALADFDLAMWQAANRRGIRGDLEVECLYYQWHEKEWLEGWLQRMRELINTFHLSDRLPRRKK
ncbi:hypothetical protein [Thermogemmata fonticola]|jgi:hypothetical protein|uniref:Uncharacterized protein n=1 Tax=Thermogemmata fonticola TaxID=2755323 RepID=A0A7V8VFY4_9BACT|nr:hypothetical protein [Thermogemmata fonticola]MBA2227308.1 hypothetical protein [Thermogemmata fonticola]